MTLKWLGSDKEIIPGITLQRQRYVVDSEYLLDLCLEHRCQRLIVGSGPEINYRQLFRKEGVRIESQNWRGAPNLPARDSILDAVARFSAADIVEMISARN